LIKLDTSLVYFHDSHPQRTMLIKH